MLNNQLFDINSKMKVNQRLTEFMETTLKDFMDLTTNHVSKLSQVKSDEIISDINKMLEVLRTELNSTVRVIKGNLVNLRESDEF